MQNTSTLWDESRLSRNNKKINGNQEESEWERWRGRGVRGRRRKRREKGRREEEEEKEGGRQRLPGDVSR